MSRLSRSTKTVLIVQPHTAKTCATARLVPNTTRCVTPTRRRRRYDLTTCGSCTSSLRLIRQPDIPGTILSFEPLYEGVLPWSLLSFSPSWCWSPWCGYASFSIGRGPATLPPLAPRHWSPHPHGPSAVVSQNLSRASPPSPIATPVSRIVSLAYTPLQPHHRASS